MRRIINKLLISEEFRYFGDHWKEDMSLHETMENFCQDKGISYVRGHPKKANLNDDSVEKLLNFFENNFSNGKIGEPNHIDEIKQSREKNTGSC